MIASSSPFKVIALGTAAVFHVVFGNAFSSDQGIKIESGAGAQQAALGSSFSDMVAGTMSPLDTTEAVDTVLPTETTEATKTYEDTQTPVALETAEVEPTQTTGITTTETLSQQQLTPTPQLSPTRTVNEVPTDTPEVPTVTLSKPLLAHTTPAIAATPTTSPLKSTPIVTAMLAKPQPSAVIQPSPPLPTPDVITADTLETAAPVASKRPTKRKVDVAKIVKKPTVSKPKKQATKRGNSNRNNTQGAATGTAEAKAKVQGNGRSQTAASGNAAASNYPGKVMRKLSRVRRPKTKAKGTAVISFRVSGNGGISALSVARSSGSSALDTAAMGVVRKAAPFPAPPKGAQRAFSIRIKGR